MVVLVSASPWPTEAKTTSVLTNPLANKHFVLNTLDYQRDILQLPTLPLEKPVAPISKPKPLATHPMVKTVAPAKPTSTTLPSIFKEIRRCEASGNYANNDTGHNGHYGAYQFSLSTWRSVGGTGNPAFASPAEQRALQLYNTSGLSPWLASQSCWGK